MILLKLGGSVVTDKSRAFSMREEVVKRLAGEIAEVGGELVIVHGGGSFGHPVATEHRLQEGLASETQLLGIAKTRLAMERLTERIVSILVSKALPAVPIQSSSVFQCRNGRIEKAEIWLVKGLLRLGCIPVLNGDVALDEARGVCILSGDQVLAYLARTLGAERAVVATDVDGLFDRGGRLISRVTRRSAAKVIPYITPSGDATGGMQGKVEELINLAEDGVPSTMVNALVKDRVRNALLGRKVKGTVFEAE